MPFYLGAGVIGFDLRDSGMPQDMEQRIEMVKSTAWDYEVPDFVVNAVMDWPGSLD